MKQETIDPCSSRPGLNEKRERIVSGGIKQVPLTCPNPDCGKSNPSKANFCNDCGWPLAGVIQPWIRHLEGHVDDRIEKTKIDAQKIENEVRDKVINQIIKMAKWVTGVFGAAGVVLLGGMVFFGFQELSGITKTVKKAESDVENEVVIFKKNLRKAKEQVVRLENSVTSVLSLSYIKTRRKSFRKYLEDLGFPTAKQAKTVEASGSKGGVVSTAQATAQTGYLSPQNSDVPLKELAFLSLMDGSSLNKVDKDIIRDLALGVHIVKPQREARKLLAIMNGLSIYFPSSFQKQPTFRYLEDDTVNLAKFTDEKVSKDAKPDPGKVRKRRAESWAKLFWAIRSADQMDENIADRLFATGWLSRELSDGLKGAGEKFVALLRKSSSLTAGQKKQVSKILDDHGFKRGGG